MYEDVGKDILQKLKFERVSYFSKDIARIMTEILPMLPPDTIICHVPTAPKRIRVRGYDQSQLIAKKLAKNKVLQYKNLVTRASNSRQLGATREKRFEQVKNSYQIKGKEVVKGAKILIVDDVTTSGATLEHLAKLLKKAGAKSVDAIVFAQAVD